jgi:hypothetical protein
VKFAQGLEAAIRAEAGRFRSEADVYAHFRQGFGDDIARRLADHTWSDQLGGIRAGEPVLQVPGRVCVIFLSGNLATAVYETPALILELWTDNRLTVDHLQREEGHWVVSESEWTDAVSPTQRPRRRLTSGCG